MRALSDNRTVICLNNNQIKMPETQNINDKLRSNERRKTKIEEMKNVLEHELLENSTFCKQTIKDICEKIKTKDRK